MQLLQTVIEAGAQSQHPCPAGRAARALRDEQPRRRALHSPKHFHRSFTELSPGRGSTHGGLRPAGAERVWVRWGLASTRGLRQPRTRLRAGQGSGGTRQGPAPGMLRQPGGGKRPRSAAPGGEEREGEESVPPLWEGLANFGTCRELPKCQQPPAAPRGTLQASPCPPQHQLTPQA